MKLGVISAGWLNRNDWQASFTKKNQNKGKNKCYSTGMFESA